MLMMCVIDRRQIAIYRDLAKNGKPWTRIATLALPADAPHTHIYSVEPIAPETGVNGTSWFSLNAMAGATGRNLGDTGRSAKDGSIWVLSLGNDPAKRIARRVDEGAVSGIETARYEAESMLGAERSLHLLRTQITGNRSRRSPPLPDGNPCGFRVEARNIQGIGTSRLACRTCIAAVESQAAIEGKFDPAFSGGAKAAGWMTLWTSSISWTCCSTGTRPNGKRWGRSRQRRCRSLGPCTGRHGKIYEVYEDDFGVEIEVHYFRHLDGSVSGVKVTPRS